MGRISDFPPWQDHWQTISLEKRLGDIRRGAYQAAYEDSRWAYEPVSDLWLDIEPDIDYSNYGSSNDRNKDQENPDDQEQEYLVLVLHSTQGDLDGVTKAH